MKHYSKPAPSDNALKSMAHCPYCGGEPTCKVCGITCEQAGGLTEDGLCARCSTQGGERR